MTGSDPIAAMSDPPPREPPREPRKVEQLLIADPSPANLLRLYGGNKPCPCEVCRAIRAGTVRLVAT